MAFNESLYEMAMTSDIPYQARQVLINVACERFGECTVDALVEWQNEQRGKTYTVAVFECGQMFGGREEGGWWYDAGTFVRIVKTFRGDEWKACQFSHRLNTKLQSRAFGPNQGRREYSSVLSDGEYRAMVFDGPVPASFPDRKPRYE